MAVNLTAPFLLGQQFGPVMAEPRLGPDHQHHLAAGRPRLRQQRRLRRGQGRRRVADQVAIRGLGGQRGVLQRDLPGLRGDATDSRGFGRPGSRQGPGGPDDGGPQRVAESDFAGAAVFLASRASDYVTGQMIRVDGGFSAT